MLPRLRPNSIALMLLILMSSFGSSVQAQNAFGRIMIVAKTPSGEPIPGVKVTVTEENLKTPIEKTTNKKGKATISVVDATKVYQFTFEYGDMKPLETSIKPTPGSSITREITLDPDAPTETATASTPGEGTVERRFTPAQKAYNEGIEAWRAGDREAAKVKVLESIEKNKELAPAHSALAGIYLEEGNYQAALASAQTFSELDPEAPRAFRLIYEAQRGLGNKEEADAALKAMSQLDGSGDAAAMIYNEGVEALKVGDRRSARARFTEALEIQPDLAAALSGLAIVLVEDESYQEAAATAERLLAIDPENKTALRVAYDAYKGLGDKEKANNAFQALAKVDPETVAKQLYDLGSEYFKNNQIDEAIDHLERSLQANPNRPKAHYQLGLCYVNKEQNAKAKEHLAKFVEMAPDDPDVVAAKEMLSFLN